MQNPMSGNLQLSSCSFNSILFDYTFFFDYTFIDAINVSQLRNK